MKVHFKAWPDTKNVDLIFIPDTDSERALLLLMQDRKFEWSGFEKTDGTFEGILRADTKTSV